jgi:tetratricopeptide (TPR) repeat protein
MAERSLERAVELGPYEPNRINAIGTAYVYLGEFDKGEEFYERAGRLMIHDFDPQQTDYGELCYFRREYEKALTYFRVGEYRNPLRPRILVCATLAQVGRLAEARAEAESVMGILRERWRGSEPFTPRAALRWYVDDFTLRRRVDVDNVIEGLTKAGFVF